MKIFLYSSPYQYYVDNLIPLANLCKNNGHVVYGSYHLNDDKNLKYMFKNDNNNYPEQLLSKKIKPDCVVLTQAWWYLDNEIAKFCNKNKIPLFIIEHACPIIRYTQRDGKKSHLYRSTSYNALTYFSYGQENVKIMKDVGYNGSNIAVGSSRLEQILNKVNEKKDGYVLFDTSNKMDDESLVKKMKNFILKSPNDKFIIREHSRSPKYYRELFKFSNVRLDNNSNESELFKYSNFIFTFPSSAMLIPALLNKNIFALYDDHFCVEARKFYKKYSNNITGLDLNQNQNHELFLSKNLLYNKKESTEQRILNHILREIK